MVVTDEGPLQKEGGIFQPFCLHIAVESYEELCDLFARLNAPSGAIPVYMNGAKQVAADPSSTYPLFIEVQNRLSKVDNT